MSEKRISKKRDEGGQRKEQEPSLLLHLDFCKHLKKLWTFQVPFLSARVGRGKGWNLCDWLESVTSICLCLGSAIL